MSLKRRGFRALIASFALIAAGSAWAKPYLYVQNAGSGDISVISIPEHELVSVIPVGEHPDDVIGSADGKTVFVNLGIEKGHKFGTPEFGEIVAVSTDTDKVLWRLKFDGWPHHLSISKTGMLYVPLFDRAHALVIDTNKREVVGKLDGLWGMHGTRLSADEKQLYAGSILTGGLYVLDVEKNEPVRVLSFRDGVRPFAFTRDEKTVYAQQSHLHGFAVYDVDKGAVTKTVDLPGLPADFQYPTDWPHNVNHGLDLSPDEKYLFAAGSAIDTVFVYTHPDLKLVKSIPVPRRP